MEGMATGRPEFLDHASRWARSCATDLVLHDASDVPYLVTVDASAHGDLGPEHFGVDDEALDLALAVLVPKSPPVPGDCTGALPCPRCAQPPSAVV